MITDKEIQEFLYQYKQFQLQGLNKEQMQEKMTALGYPDDIISTWASVNYSYDFLVDLLD